MGRLFWKFFLSILLAQVAATIGIGGAIWLRDQARQRNGEPTLDLGPPAVIMLDAAAATLKHGGLDGLRELAATSRRMHLYVLDDQGVELLGRTVPVKLRAEVERKLENGAQTHAVARLTGPDGRHYLAFASRMPGAHQGLGPDARGAPAREGSGQGFGHHVGRWLPVAAATVASFLFAALLAWYFSRPIRALRGAFEAAAAGDLAPKFAEARMVAGGDELAELGHDFDRMSAQLRTLMDGQRRLLHDVSHELRSPLTRLQAAIGLAHQQPDKIGASLERIERESVRMDRLVGELLTLSRLEAATAPRVQETVDLVEMIEQIAEDARFEAGARIGVAAPNPAALPLTVRAAPDLLWSAVENVVRNAVRHGGGGPVDVALHPEDGLAHIEVMDRGPGIPEEHLGQIFEPFFRSNPTQNNVDGHGLGLAIAKRVIETHGGTITAANREGGGLRVTLTLPRAG